MLEEAVRIVKGAREKRDNVQLSEYVNGLAMTCESLGKEERARELHGEAERLWNRGCRAMC